MRFDITPEERSTVLVNLRRLEEERQKDIFKAIEELRD